VHTALELQVDQKIGLFRQQLADAKAGGKLTIYLSIPFSSRGGGYRGINIDVAAALTQSLSTYLGVDRVFMLNPSVKAADLDASAGQGDYLYMWSAVLSGEDGLATNLDAAYMTGPSDFSRALGIDGDNKIAAVERLFESRLASDANFKQAVDNGKILKRDFLVYYSLRSGTAFSAGAHDEWNVIANVNALRRQKYGDDGFGKQVAVWFDGRELSPNSYETHVSTGNEKPCEPVPKAHK